MRVASHKHCISFHGDCSNSQIKRANADVLGTQTLIDILCCRIKRQDGQITEVMSREFELLIGKRQVYTWAPDLRQSTPHLLLYSDHCNRQIVSRMALDRGDNVRVTMLM